MASKFKYAPPPKKAEKVSSTKSATLAKADDFQQLREERRVADVEAGRTIYNRMMQDNLTRSSTIAQTRNQLEGGRPFDPKELEAQGAAWQTNVNFGDAQAARDRDLLPYWKMVNDVPNRATFTIDSNSTDSGKWAVSFAECFDEFLEDWGAPYQVEFMNFCSNFVNFGPGIVRFEEKFSPRYKAVNVQRVMWPKNARMSPDEWEVMVCTSEMTATDLYKKVRNKKTEDRSKFAGWNPNAVKAAIVQMKDGGQYPDYRDYTRYQDTLVNNDIAITTPFQPLTIVWLFIKNFDDKVGCYAFSQSAGVEEFLFEDDEYADSFREVLGAVWYDTGTDSMIHSIKGFGIKNFFFSTLMNRVKSRAVDSSTLSMGVNFQYDDASMPDESPPVENYGPFTIFPNGLKQLSVYPQIQQGMGILGMLQQNQSENNSLYSENKQQIENTDTATQAKILATMQGQLSEASAALFLAQLGENVFKEQVRRLRRKGSSDEDAKEFVRRLRERGVPDKVIFDAKIRVKTGANAGTSNPAMVALKFQQGLALSKMPGVNARWFLENFIAYTYGAQAVNKALLPVGVDSEPQQRREAIMENGSFGQGIELPVAPEDAHFEHIQEHLKPLMGMIQMFNQKGQLSPEQIAALTIGIEHTGQHMQYLSTDETKKEEMQAVTPDFRQVQSVVRGIITRMQSGQGPPVAQAPQ